MVILDTSIIIDHIRQKDSADTALSKVTLQKEFLALSVISIEELYEGKSTRVSKKAQDLKKTLDPLAILPYTFEIAKLAGELMRDRNRPLQFADAAIAATTILNGGALYTLNTKDFAGIPHLHLYEF